MPFPSPPWHLVAQAWLSVFVLGRSGPERVRGDRPGGVYAAAFVDYEEGGVLTYSELVVARLLLDGTRPRIRITDIWVDSEASRDGARALWAIPKELARLTRTDQPLRVATRTSWSAAGGGRDLAAATFTAWPAAAPVRTPYRLSAWQVRNGGSPGASRVVTPIAGSARTAPCRAVWEIDPRSPVGFLAGRRPVLSMRLRDARLRFG